MEPSAEPISILLSLKAYRLREIKFKGQSDSLGMIDKILENQHDSPALPMPHHKMRFIWWQSTRVRDQEFKYVFLLIMDKAF